MTPQRCGPTSPMSSLAPAYDGEQVSASQLPLGVLAAELGETVLQDADWVFPCKGPGDVCHPTIKYYYAAEDLFKRCSDIVKELLDDAPAMWPGTATWELPQEEPLGPLGSSCVETAQALDVGKFEVGTLRCPLALVAKRNHVMKSLLADCAGG